MIAMLLLLCAALAAPLSAAPDLPDWRAFEGAPAPAPGRRHVANGGGRSWRPKTELVRLHCDAPDFKGAIDFSLEGKVEMPVRRQPGGRIFGAFDLTLVTPSGSLSQKGLLLEGEIAGPGHWVSLSRPGTRRADGTIAAIPNQVHSLIFKLDGMDAPMLTYLDGERVSTIVVRCRR